MTRNKIYTKLRQGNKVQYILLAFCIFLSVLLVSAFALMYFSPTVQEVLPEGGDTRKMAVLLLGATAVGCSIFTLYASMLFFRYKSGEYGVFLALGEQKKHLSVQLFRELVLLTAGAAGLGLLGAVPVSWLIWKFFESFLVSTEEMAYRLGVGGFLTGLVFTVILALLLGIAGGRFMKRTNVMEVLRTRHQPEMVKKIPSWTFGAGVLLILTGLGGALGLPRVFVYILHRGAPAFLNLFYFLAVGGIYLVLLSVVGQSRVGKNKEKYYKKLVSLSLMRFSARTATRNMCVIVLLLFAGIFASFYGTLYMTGEQFADSETTRDFAMHYPVEENQVSKEEIYNLAEDYQVEITEYVQEEGADLVISYEAVEYSQKDTYETVEKVKSKTALFFSKKAYEQLTGQKTEINQGTYKTITPVNYKESIWDITEGLFGAMNPETGTELVLEFQGTLEYNSLTGMSDPFAYVISDGDYQTLTESLGQDWKECLVFFDVKEPEEAYPFARALYEEYVSRAGKRSAYMGYYDAWEALKAEEKGETYPYDGKIELDARDTRLLSDWKYGPSFQIMNSQERMQTMAVYIMLCLYIFLITLAAAGVMTYVRSISVALENREIFVSLEKLGADNSYRRKILKSQLAKIFLYPGILGCGTGFLFSLGVSCTNDGRLTISEIGNLAGLLGISVFILLLLWVIYLISRRKAERITGIH